MAANSAIHYLFAKTLYFNDSKLELRNVPLHLGQAERGLGNKNALS